jgi:hypothetical protein
VNWLIRFGMKNGWRRGVVGGNRLWVILGGAALLGHLAGRALRREPEVLFLEELALGESLQVTLDSGT